MAQQVSQAMYFDLDGQLLEIKRQLRQTNGYPFDPKKLRTHLQAAIEGRWNGTAVTGHFSRDMREEDWELLENVSRVTNSVAALKLVPFLKPDENYVNGEEMVRRARMELASNFGQEDAEWLLEHQAEIPDEWRKFYLVFTGTVWRGSRGHRGVAYLYWDGGRWFLHFHWLDLDWHSIGRLLRLRK